MTGSLASGTVLADTYQVLRLVGAGGMGEVYEATHNRLAGRYAVKILLAEIMNRPEIFERFRREAEVTSGLRHPNIVQVLDFNATPEGHPYLVMEYLEGTELAAEISRVGPMPVNRVLDIVGQIASALAAAHNHKIVHRDLKPQNLFLVRLPGEDREVVKVVDFGISKVREATMNLTQEAAIMGTPQYMAPEQAQGKQTQIDERTDQFALAAITYELLTGRPAFQADSLPAILYQVVHEQPQPIREFAPAVGNDLAAVVGKGLSKLPNDRYPNVLTFHRELVRAAATGYNIQTAKLPEPIPTGNWHAPVATNPTTLGLAAATFEAKTSRSTAGRRYWLPIGIAGMLALGGVVFFVLRGGNDAADRKPNSENKVTAARSNTAPNPMDKSTLAEAPIMGQVSMIDVENAPSDLQITVDGVLKDLPLTIPRGPQVHRLRFEAVGYEPYEVGVDGTRERRTLRLAMKKTDSLNPQAPVISDPPSSARKRLSEGKTKRASNPSASGNLLLDL
jgi:serine/threonine protein kinase